MDGEHMEDGGSPRVEKEKPEMPSVSDRCRLVMMRQVTPCFLMVLMFIFIIPKGLIITNWTDEESQACGIAFCYDYHYKSMLILIAMVASFFLLWVTIFFLWMTNREEEAEETLQPFISLSVLVCFIGVNFILIMFVEIWTKRRDTVFIFPEFYDNSTDCRDPMVNVTENVYDVAVQTFKVESALYLVIFGIIGILIFIQVLRVAYDMLSYRFYLFMYRIYDRIYLLVRGEETDKTSRYYRKRTAPVTIRKI